MPDDPEVTVKWGEAAADDLARMKALHSGSHCWITPGGHLVAVTPGAIERLSELRFDGVPVRFDEALPGTVK